MNIKQYEFQPFQSKKVPCIGDVTLSSPTTSRRRRAYARRRPAVAKGVRDMPTQIQVRVRRLEEGQAEGNAGEEAVSEMEKMWPGLIK